MSANSFLPVVTNVAGFTSIGSGHGRWMAIGSCVHVSMVITGVSGPGGAAAVEFPIPVPRDKDFASALADGNGVVQHSGGGAYNFQISPVPGTQNMRISTTAPVPAFAGHNITVECSYSRFS
jgi:hypothetical protein